MLPGSGHGPYRTARGAVVEEPVNRTILLMDIEGSGSRSDVEQGVLRRLLYGVLKETLSAASVEATEYRTEDRGDGVLTLLDATVPKPQLIRALLTETPMRLAAANRLSSQGTQVRLRMVLHSGEVALDAYGAVGSDLVEGFRLLDSDPLRAALKETDEPCVLCVSEAVHRGVVRHAHPGIEPEHFHRFEIRGKGSEGRLGGWIHDRSRKRAEDGTAEAATTADTAAADRGSGGSGGPAGPFPPPSGSGNFFFGHSPQITGDVVAGHKIVGLPWDGGADR